MKVIISAEAERDLEAIAGAIAKDNPRRSLSFVDELESRCLTLADSPKAFPLLHRHRGSKIRRRVHRNYLIFYRVDGDRIDIIRILHGAMDCERLLFPETS